MIFELDVNFEDDVFLVVDQDEAIALLDTKEHSFEDVGIVIE